MAQTEEAAAVPSFWEVIARSRSGEKVDEKTFDTAIFRTAERLRKEYDVAYNPEEPVPCDDALADRVFAAGLEFYSQIGTYCVDTGRVTRFTRGEIEAAIAAAPAALQCGQGADVVSMAHRGVEGTAEPIIFGGIQTAIFSDEEMAFRIYRECARDYCIDGVWGGVVLKIDGKYDVIAGTPMEIYAYRKHAVVMRRAVAAAGRPGMVIVNNAPLSAATIAMYDKDAGLRPTDRCASSGVSEMRVGYDDLNRAAFALASDIHIRGGCPTVLGGWSGSIPGAAIVAVAGALQSLVVNKAHSTGPNVSLFRERSRGTRAGIWAESLALQALSRNTKIVLTGTHGDHPAAGPGTKQYLYEAAAGFVGVVASGGHQLSGTRKFVIGQTPNYGTPLESRWMGEVCKSAAGMSRKQACEIVHHLLTKYETNLKDPPAGTTYEHLYDVETDEPRPEYLQLYEEVKTELAGMGFAVRSWPRSERVRA